MHTLIEKYLDEIKELCTTHYVQELSVFGSISGKEFNATSDIDFLVTFSVNLELLNYADNYFGLKENLEFLLNRKVDLVSTGSLKNPVLIREIDRTKSMLYAA